MMAACSVHQFGSVEKLLLIVIIPILPILVIVVVICILLVVLVVIVIVAIILGWSLLTVAILNCWLLGVVILLGLWVLACMAELWSHHGEHHRRLVDLSCHYYCHQMVLGLLACNHCH
jgi:hypothetical protein